KAVDLLCACVDKETMAPGMIVGKTLRFWATALRFAGSLVARQQFLPGLARNDGSYRARWEPVYAGPDATRRSRLSQAMPAACRALTRAADAPPQKAAADVLSVFVGRVVDYLVRVSLLPQEAVIRPGRRLLKTTFASVHDQW